MFSLELTEVVTEIGKDAFSLGYSLQNVAIPPNVALADDIFIHREQQEFINQHLEGKSEELQRLIKKCSWTDLQQLFGGLEERIVQELRHRFDDLPVHSVVYYHYHPGALQRLIELDPTGNQQDCLGMTPLHILTCSSVHDLELYCVIVEKYPTNLITKDSWGALPLLYAFWGAIPADIIGFLLESYQSLYPGHVFNWTMMLKTMGRTDTQKERIENLLHVRQMLFPEQPIDWEYLLNEFVEPSEFCLHQSELFQERIRFLFRCSMSA
jgi:hypothetical protein